MAGWLGGLLSGIGGIISAGIGSNNTNSTNESNERMNEANNQANAENVAATNEANQSMNEATNQANKDIAAATNEANENIAAATNQANKEISEGVNATNRQIAEENLNYQREYNQTIFDREDNATRRKLEDSIKSGVNILSGVEGAGVGGTATPLNNSYQAQGYTAQGYTAEGVTMAMERAEATHNEATKYMPMQQIANIGEAVNNGIMSEANARKTNADADAQNIKNTYVADEEEAEILKTRAEIEELHRKGKIEDAEYEEYLKGSEERLKALRLSNESTEENIKKTKAETQNVYANTNNTNANTELAKEKTKTESVTRNDNHVMSKIQQDLGNLEQSYLQQTIDERVLSTKLENEFKQAQTDKERAEIINTYVRTGCMISSEARAWLTTLKPKERQTIFGVNHATTITKLFGL